MMKLKYLKESERHIFVHFMLFSDLNRNERNKGNILLENLFELPSVLKLCCKKNREILYTLQPISPNENIADKYNTI